MRPVKNVTDPVTVKFKLKLSQLIDVNLRNQIMTTNLWVEQFWFDHKLVRPESSHVREMTCHIIGWNILGLFGPFHLIEYPGPPRRPVWTALLQSHFHKLTSCCH